MTHANWLRSFEGGLVSLEYSYSMLNSSLEKSFFDSGTVFCASGEELHYSAN